jgi:hypothetical protein
MKQEDFKTLAGQWLGDSNVQGERSVPIQGFIYENGAFYTAPRGGTATQVPGRMKIADLGGEDDVRGSPRRVGLAVARQDQDRGPGRHPRAPEVEVSPVARGGAS